MEVKHGEKVTSEGKEWPHVAVCGVITALVAEKPLVMANKTGPYTLDQHEGWQMLNQTRICDAANDAKILERLITLTS